MDGNPPVSIKETSEMQKVERMKKHHSINKHLKISLSVWGPLVFSVLSQLAFSFRPGLCVFNSVLNYTDTY